MVYTTRKSPGGAALRLTIGATVNPTSSTAYNWVLPRIWIAGGGGHKEWAWLNALVCQYAHLQTYLEDPVAFEEEVQKREDAGNPDAPDWLRVSPDEHGDLVRAPASSDGVPLVSPPAPTAGNGGAVVSLPPPTEAGPSLKAGGRILIVGRERYETGFMRDAMVHPEHGPITLVEMEDRDCTTWFSSEWCRDFNAKAVGCLHGLNPPRPIGPTQGSSRLWSDILAELEAGPSIVRGGGVSRALQQFPWSAKARVLRGRGSAPYAVWTTVLAG